MPLGFLLFAAFVAVPLVEIALFIQIGGWIGLWPTLATILATAAIGAWTIRLQGFALAQRARERFDRKELPVRETFDGLCLAVAGLLLLTPGFFTDVIGALLLLPPFRALAYRRVSARVQVVREQAADGSQSKRQPDIIDVDYEEIDEESNKPMPPPGGTWDRRN
ncbi:MAG: FxsA family protein [Geminicoccaceae bacterium]